MPALFLEPGDVTVPRISPLEAKDRLSSAEEHIYLDVRTVPEFVSGHPPDAFNVPITELNPVLGQMELNPRFLSILEATFPKDTKFVVGCRSGGRSEMAVQLMREAGFRNAANMAGGFAGVMATSGEVIEEGWSTLGYPTERGEGGKRSYSSLSECRR